MKFEEALAAMREGKIVRLKEEEDSFLYKMGETIICFKDGKTKITEKGIYYLCPDQPIDKWRFYGDLDHQHIMSEDWEIVD